MLPPSYRKLYGNVQAIKVHEAPSSPWSVRLSVSPVGPALSHGCGTRLIFTTHVFDVTSTERRLSTANCLAEYNNCEVQKDLTVEDEESRSRGVGVISSLSYQRAMRDATA
ncbi:hypothetical protein ACLKA6_010927 [Drosophila palustris]